MRKKYKRILKNLTVILIIMAIGAIFFIMGYFFAIKEIGTKFLVDLQQCSNVCGLVSRGFLRW